MTELEIEIEDLQSQILELQRQLDTLQGALILENKTSAVRPDHAPDTSLTVEYRAAASVPKSPTTHEVLLQQNRLVIEDPPPVEGEEQIHGGTRYRWQQAAWVPLPPQTREGDYAISE